MWLPREGPASSASADISVFCSRTQSNQLHDVSQGLSFARMAGPGARSDACRTRLCFRTIARIFPTNCMGDCGESFPGLHDETCPNTLTIQPLSDIEISLIGCFTWSCKWKQSAERTQHRVQHPLRARQTDTVPASMVAGLISPKHNQLYRLTNLSGATL
jgi:hypothetical protein